MNEIEDDVLCRRWVHAHEEDNDEEMVFRPSEHPLGPSRGRTSFELRADGTFSESGLGAADVPGGGERDVAAGSRQHHAQRGGARGVPRVLPIASADQRLVIRK
jgi:hypothetical protein